MYIKLFDVLYTAQLVNKCIVTVAGKLIRIRMEQSKVQNNVSNHGETILKEE